MTKSQLVENVQGRFPDVKKYVVKEVVNAIFEEIVSGLVSDGEVGLPGFGSFTRKVRNAPHWDIKEKKMVEAKPVNRVVFKVGADFKRQVRGNGE